MHGTHPTTIGDDVTIGHGAIVHGCTIERPVLVGMGAILLNGVESARHDRRGRTLLTEGTVVPPRSLVMGSPGKVRRALTDDEVASIRGYAERLRAVPARLHGRREPGPWPMASQQTQPARGMRDFLPEDVRRREYVIDIVRDVYERYGFEPLETPALENIETLTRQVRRRRQPADLQDAAARRARGVAARPISRCATISPCRWRASSPSIGRAAEVLQAVPDSAGVARRSAGPWPFPRVLSVRRRRVRIDVAGGRGGACAAVSGRLARLGFDEFVIRLNHRGCSALLGVRGVPADAARGRARRARQARQDRRDGVRKELAARGVDEAGDRLRRSSSGKGAGDPPGQRACSSGCERSRAQHGGPAASTHSADDRRGSAADERRAHGGSSTPAWRAGCRTTPAHHGNRGRRIWPAAWAVAAATTGWSACSSGEQVPACGFSLGLERILVVMAERDMFPPTCRRRPGRDGHHCRRGPREDALRWRRTARRRACAWRCIPRADSSASSSSTRRRASVRVRRASSAATSWRAAKSRSRTWRPATSSRSPRADVRRIFAVVSRHRTDLDATGDRDRHQSNEHHEHLGNLVSHPHLRRAARRRRRPADVVLLGWVHRVRDLGGVLFFDVRDRYGITQVVVRDDDGRWSQAAKRLRPEFVVGVTGRVERRVARDRQPEDRDRRGRGRSRREIAAAQRRQDAAVSDQRRRAGRRGDAAALPLSRSAPAAAAAEPDPAPPAWRWRSARYFDEQGFLEIETPILTKSTPEGARDYLVPSRVHPGEFFALPQSPQIFKQILMIAGMDRYFQIARCFRDEDLRADRQPEFTQVDVEISFATEDLVFAIVEPLMRAAMALIGREAPRRSAACRTPRRSRRYGSDKPDLRCGMAITDLSAAFAASELLASSAIALEAGGECAASSCRRRARTRAKSSTSCRRGEAARRRRPRLGASRRRRRSELRAQGGRRRRDSRALELAGAGAGRPAADGRRAAASRRRGCSASCG